MRGPCLHWTHKRETCFKIKNKAKLQNNYYNSRLFIYLNYFYFPELSLLLPWKRHSSCSSLVRVPVELFTCPSRLIFWCIKWLVLFPPFSLSDHIYIYKVIASIIWYIPGEIDIISGCDYLYLKSMPIKNPAEISNITIIHYKRHKQKVCSSPDSSSNHSQETDIIRKINKWTVSPIWSMTYSVIKAGYHLPICFSIYKIIWNTKCCNVQIDNCFSEDTVGIKRKHIVDI